jgi:tetratricopeptide (TPR) repeat protein
MKKLLPLVLVLAAVVVVALRNDGDRQAPAELNRIAKLYLNGDTDAALTELSSYLADRPTDARAWTIQGNILEVLDRSDEAEVAYRRALEIAPTHVAAITGMGILARKRGDSTRALEYYARAVELEPDYAQAYSSMAAIELRRGNYDEALRLGKLAYSKDKQDPVVVANLAVAFHYVGDVAERDRYTALAVVLKYKNVEALRKIYAGELSVREE